MPLECEEFRAPVWASQTLGVIDMPPESTILNPSGLNDRTP